MNVAISGRIHLARYIMILGIVILHIPPYVPLDQVSGFFESIKAFFSHGVFRSSVPVLSAISGFLLFREFDKKSYKNIFKSKIKTLAIPMIIWNLPLLFLAYVLQAYFSAGQGLSFKAYPFEIKNWLDGLLGVSGTPINYPLNFLRDIFALSLLSPLFYLMLKRFHLGGLAVISLFFWFDMDGNTVIRNQMAINYCCGALIAIKGWDLCLLDKYRLYCLIGLIGVSILIVVIPIENRSYFRVIAPFLVWPILSYFNDGKIGAFVLRNSQKSFFIFCSHAPILILVSFIYQKLCSENNFYPIFWLITPLIVIFITHSFYRFGYRYFPKLMKVALGGR